MKVALALRAAMLAVALAVILAPIPYLAREAADGASAHHSHLTYLEAFRASDLDAERGVALWWLVAAGALAWSARAHRRGRSSPAARAAHWVLVVAASVLVFTRPIYFAATGQHMDRLTGSGVIDIAALTYLIAVIAGAVAKLAEEPRVS